MELCRCSMCKYVDLNVKKGEEKCKFYSKIPLEILDENKECKHYKCICMKDVE